MTKMRILGTTLILSAVLVGCGDSDSSAGASGTQSNGGVKTYTSGEVLKITTKVEAENAVAAINSLNSGVNKISPANTGTRAPSLSSVNETQNCSGGGSIIISGKSDDTSVDMKMSYENCNQSGMTLSGTSTTVGTNSAGLIKLKITTNNLKYEFTNSDYYNMNLILDYETSDVYKADINYRGILNYSMQGVSGKMAYDDFHVLVDQSSKLDLSGKVSIEADQNTCQNGVYNIKTSDPLTATSNGYSSGTMLINGTKYVYNNDGTADVTFPDGTTSKITQGAPLTCN